MSTITLPNIRVSSDLTVSLKLKDDGVAIDWSTLSNVKVSIYSDAQRALAGRCTVSIDEDDPTLLVCTYAANKPQYVGVNRVVVCAKYMGETKTYDKPAFNFVRWTDDQAGQTITIDDPDIDVEISVEDISSSILQEAVDAAFTAADRANDAAAAAEHMVDIHTGPQGEDGKSAYQCAVDEGYIGTEEEWLASLKGTDGADGADGDPAGFGTVSASVGANTGTPSVTVTTSGPDTAKNITFAFDNLKGATGETGATPAFSIGTVTTGAAGSQAAATITGTAAAPVLNLTIPQGDQGNTGSSVDYAYELVNNLTTNDATKGLSAAQGVVLDGKVTQLEAKVDDISTGKYYGYYATAADLPDDATVDGFAYVGGGPTYTIYNCEGGVWTSTGITVNQSPVGNDEDIDQNADGKLQFANRVYNSLQPNGMGYKILRKDASFSTQVTDTNTIYEIRYPFNLGGNEFAMPSGCVLRFVGGSISNGTITTNPFRVVADNDVSILKGISFDGSYITNETIFVNWFDFVTDGVTDNYNAFKRLQSLINEKKTGSLVFGKEKNYATSVVLSYITNIYHRDAQCAFRLISCDIDIDLNGSTISLKSSNTAVSVIINLIDCRGTLRNGNIIGDRQTHDYSSYTDYQGNPSTNFEQNYGILQVGGDMIFSDLNISYGVGDGMMVGSGNMYLDGEVYSYNGKYRVTDCTIHYCGRNGISAHSSYGKNIVENCYIHHIGAYDNLVGYAPQAGIDFEFEEGLGNIPDIYLNNNTFEDCSRRGISIANNSPMNTFYCYNSSFIRAALNLSSLPSAKDAVVENCYIEDSGSSTQLEKTHYMSKYIVMRSCIMKGIIHMAQPPKLFDDCVIESSSSLTASESMFGRNPSSSTPSYAFRNCKVTVNSGVIEFGYQEDVKDTTFIFNSGMPNAGVGCNEQTFTRCTFISNHEHLAIYGLGGAKTMNFVDCKIKWPGTYNYNIAGYSKQGTAYFVGCEFESTMLSHRQGNIVAEGCSFSGCTFGSESGGVATPSYFKNCTMTNCDGTSQKEQSFINCSIISTSTVAKSSVLGINGTSSRGKHKFISSYIYARNFTSPTADVYSEYEDCVLDIDNASLPHAVVRDSVVRASVANSATTFENSKYYLNGIETPARSGATADRPSASAVVAGFTYFDTDLGKMIVSNGTDWVNMDGTAL